MIHMSVINDIGKTIRYAGRNGIIPAMYAARERLAHRFGQQYQYEPPSEEDLETQRRDWKRLQDGEEPEEVFRVPCRLRYAPKISILVPTYDPDPLFFSEMIRSVMQQTYGSFELIIADGTPDEPLQQNVIVEKKTFSLGSAREEKHLTPEEIVQMFGDEHVLYRKLAGNGGISENTNAAVHFATGDYVAFLDHDDVLTPDALYESALMIMKTGAEIVYSDEDKCDSQAVRFYEPNVKPDFNLDLLYSNNYICHFMLMRTELFRALKLRPAFDGAQDYDLILRAPKSEIAHVPRVLYHWRDHAASTAGNPASKMYAYEAGKRALEDYFRERRMEVRIHDSRHLGFYKVEYVPDIFAVRSSVGVVGGKVLDRRHRIIGGMMDEDGNVFFEGLHDQESGEMHRADTAQDAAAVDVRCMRIRPELQGLYKEVFGATYETHFMPASRDYKEKSIRFCREAAKMGYVTVWDPSLKKITEN